MRIPTRPGIAFTVLLVSIIAIAGFVAAVSTRTVLTAQIDEKSEGVSRFIDSNADETGEALTEKLDTEKDIDSVESPVEVSEAVLLVDAGGAVIKAQTTG